MFSTCELCSPLPQGLPTLLLGSCQPRAHFHSRRSVAIRRYSEFKSRRSSGASPTEQRSTRRNSISGSSPNTAAPRHLTAVNGSQRQSTAPKLTSKLCPRVLLPVAALRLNPTYSDLFRVKKIKNVNDKRPTHVNTRFQLADLPPHPAADHPRQNKRCF
jgi:hypothetical protein